MDSGVSFVGFNELKLAVQRNPRMVLDEARNFLTRGLAAYKAGIIRGPWRVGGPGGGSPVSNDPRYPRRHQRQRSGNLRDTHITKVSGLMGIIGPNVAAAPYAKYVHHGTSRMAGRPWLEYVKDTKREKIEKLYRGMLKNIAGDLAK